MYFVLTHPDLTPLVIWPSTADRSKWFEGLRVLVEIQQARVLPSQFPYHDRATAVLQLWYSLGGLGQERYRQPLGNALRSPYDAS